MGRIPWGLELLKLTYPRQKTPDISPIFKADTVRLHVSREKDGKLRIVYAGWDDAGQRLIMLEARWMRR